MGFLADTWLIGNRRAPGPYGRTQDQLTRVLALPLILIGVVCAILWVVGSLAS